MDFYFSLSPEQIWNLYQNKTWQIASNETIGCQNWSVDAYPNDKLDDGAAVRSNSILILGNLSPFINSVPSISTLTLNTTAPLTNNTNANLTVYNVTSDTDNDNGRVIYNWLENDRASPGPGRSITVVNMPFEGVNNSDGTYSAWDYSGYHNNGTAISGTVSGATFNTTGGIDGRGAYRFYGVDDYINIPASASINALSKNGSISFWTKNEVTPTQWDALVSRSPAWSGWGFFYNSGTTVQLFVGAYNSDVATATITPTQWNHIVGTFDGKNIRIFVNGVEGTADSTTTTNLFSGLVSTTPIEIGRMVNSNTYNINGHIDELMIFNISLSTEQIWNLYQNKTWQIASSETIGGQNWSVDAYPNDKLDDGGFLQSNQVIILDVAGVEAGAPVYAPTAPTTNLSITRDILQAYVNGTNMSGTITLHLNFSNNGTADAAIPNVTFQFFSFVEGQANYTSFIFNVSRSNFTNSTFNTALLTTGKYFINISVVNLSYPGAAAFPSLNYTQVNITIDNSPPNVTLNMSRPNPALSNYNGSNFSEATGMVTFNASVTDQTVGSVGSVIMNFTNSSDMQAGTMFTRIAAFVSGAVYNVSFANISENFTEGLHQMNIIGNDSLNNTNITTSVWFKIDRSPPNVSTLAGFVNNSNYSELSGTFTFNVTVIDGVVGVLAVNFSTTNASNLGGVAGNFTAGNNTGTWGISFANTLQLYEGLHQMRVMAYDYLNHTNLTTEIWFGVDRTAPNASNLNIMGMLTPAALTDTVNFSENVVAQYGMITFNVTAIDGYRGVLSVNMSFDNASGNAGGTPFNGTATNYSGNWNVSFFNISANLTDGLHTVRVMANDGLNNSNRNSTITFRVDKEVPNASFVNTVTTGANFTEATGRVLFNASVIDGSIGVLEVNMSFDNASGVGGTAFNRTAANFSGYWNVTLENISANLTDGLHTIRIMANDRFNHSNRTSTFTFRVDREVPNASFVNTVTAGANFTEATGRVVFNASVIDGVTDISTVNMSFDNASGVGGTAFNRTAANFSGYWNVTLENISANLTDGLHTIRIMANDFVNHSNRTATFTFRVDGEPPNASFVNNFANNSNRS